MYKFLKVKPAFFVFMVLFIASGCTEHTYRERPQAVATIFPLYDIGRNIAGERVDMHMLLRPGASPHTFSLSPGDIKKISGASVIFAVGESLDEWSIQAAEAAGIEEVYKVSEGVNLRASAEDHSHGHNGDWDPHYWLSIENAEIIAENIYDKLSEKFPEDRGYFKENLEAYLEELEEADRKIRETLSEVQGRKLVVKHDAWGYFAEEYGLEIAGFFSSSSAHETTQRHMKSLYENVRKEGVKAVFYEPQFSVETVEQFAGDLGLELFMIDPLGGHEERDSYINMMLYNAEKISRGLNQ